MVSLILLPSFFFFKCFIVLSLACDGVYSTGKRHAASEGAAGAEDQNDPGQHPAAARRAQTHPRAATESPRPGHTGSI